MGRCSNSTSDTVDSVAEVLGDRLTDIEEALRHASDAQAMEKERVSQLEERLKSLEHDIYDDIDRLTKEAAEAKDLVSATTGTLDAKLDALSLALPASRCLPPSAVPGATDAKADATVADVVVIVNTDMQAPLGTSAVSSTAHELGELRPAAERVSEDGRSEVKELATGGQERGLRMGAGIGMEGRIRHYSRHGMGVGCVTRW